MRRLKSHDEVRVVEDTASLKKGDLYIVLDGCVNPTHKDNDAERCVRVAAVNGGKTGSYYHWKFKLVEKVEKVVYFSDEDFVV